MIKVYMEKPKAWAVEIATFADDEIYKACFDGLEKLAKDQGYIITESCEETADDVRIPVEQFQSLRMDIAEAMLHQQIIEPSYYYTEDDKGCVQLTEEGQAEFNKCHDSAELILIENGLLMADD